MAEDDAVKRLEARLTRLEAAVSQQSGAANTAAMPIGAIADPGPWPPYGGGGGWWGGGRPHPIVDSATYAASYRPPTAVVDPGPWPIYGGGGYGGYRPGTGPIGDPAVYANSAMARVGVGHVGDPPPLDVSRFTVTQLESTLHSINAEKARLASIETMVTQQLEKLKGQQG
jgi:hypothetical protein